MTALIILAAGESARLGSPKQLLDLEGKPLLEHIIEAGLNSLCTHTLVVLGANQATIYDAVKHLRVSFIQNRDWQNGMGTSISTALNDLAEKTLPVESVILSTCDQPFLSPEILNRLIYTSTSKECKIVASKYSDTCGVPALFKSELFPDLASLDGKQGARKVIEKNIADVETIDFPEGAIDIDTEADWLDFKRRRSSLKSDSM